MPKSVSTLQNQISGCERSIGNNERMLRNDGKPKFEFQFRFQSFCCNCQKYPTGPGIGKL